MQYVIVLCGLPGSGKSTVSEHLRGLGFVWVNQDTLGTRQQCESAARQALAAGQSIVVDRCNFNATQRSHWINIARETCNSGVELIAVALVVDPGECIRRVKQRKGHASLQGNKAVPVVKGMLSQWQDPIYREGFQRIIFTRNNDDIGHFTEFASTLLPPPGPPLPNSAPPPGPPSTPWRPPGGQATLFQAWGRAHPNPQLPPPGPPMNGHLPPQPFSHSAPPNHAPPPYRPPHNSSHPTPRPSSMPTPDPADFAPTAAGSILDASDPSDTRPILLFDLNGTLTSHTVRRRSAGLNRLRPGTEELARLAGTFRLGIFTSSTHYTVSVVRKMLEGAAGQQLFEPGLILYRAHTAPVSREHVQAGGKSWDTVKPLARWFSKAHRVVLFDDDAYKAVPGEEGNMVLVPCWEDEQAPCDLVRRLVDCVMEVLGGLGPEEDVRLHTGRMRKMLAGGDDNAAADSADVTAELLQLVGAGC